MVSRTVKPEQVEKAILEALAEYSDESTRKLEQMLKTTSRETSREIKASAPSGGKYARGWSHKAIGGGAYKLTRVVYNRTDYQLIHLLENPHRTGRYKGGQYPKKVDYTGTIKRIEEEETNKFYEEVISKL